MFLTLQSNRAKTVTLHHSSHKNNTQAAAPQSMDNLPLPPELHMAAELAATLPPLLAGYTTHLMVDAEVARLYDDLLQQLPVHSRFVVPSGERFKTLDTAAAMWQHLLAHGADRGSLVLAIGGGVTTDMAAFVASTYMRGIRFILCPTTLLSQVDASIGGKTGIDFAGGKNLVGTFAQPEAVVVWPGWLQTLPERELYSGYAEVLKHGLIADRAYWLAHSAIQPEQADAAHMVRHSIALKYSVVQQDPTEKGLRKILNYGHTIGHAIESYGLTTPSPLLHGEAIALGMVLEAQLAVEVAGLAQAEADEIAQRLTALGYPARLSAEGIPAMMQYMGMDKKNRAGGLRFSLPSAIGHCLYDVEVEATLVQKLLTQYASI